MITAPDYDCEALIYCLCDLKQRYDLDIYLEPGTAIAFDAGILVGEVMDIMENDGPIAILDISATCHMPDVLEAPYRPGLLAEADTGTGVLVRLGGPSCLAGGFYCHLSMTSCKIYFDLLRHPLSPCKDFFESIRI